MWGLLLANIMPLSDDPTKNSWNRRDEHMRDLMQRSAGKRGLEVTVGPHGTGSGYGPNWDSINILDLENSKLPDSTYDFIICNAVLVHARNPLACASEITRVAKIGCELYAETSFFTPFHPVEVWNENMGMFLDGTGDATSHNGRDFGGDYWRYTPMSLAMLFSAFKKDRHVGIFGGGGLSYCGIKDSDGETYRPLVKNHSILSNAKSNKISIIVPSMYRAEQFGKCVKRIQETTVGRGVEIIAVVDGQCKDTLNKAAELGLIVVYNEKHLGALSSWNRGLRICTGDPIVCVGDDTHCHDNWLEEALKSHATLPEGSGVVGLNPLHDAGYIKTHCSHFLVDRKAIRELLGGVLFYDKWYRHFASDNETLERAMKAGRYVPSEKAIVEHRHTRLSQAKNDAVYDMVLQYATEDLMMLAKRRKAGFPNDFEAIL
jgi:hypothetical protein